MPPQRGHVEITPTEQPAPQAIAHPTAPPPHAGRVEDKPAPRNGRVDVTAYAAAIGLASVAALLSVRGMVQLFPGTPLLIIAMASIQSGQCS